MNLTNIREGELKEVFSALEEAFDVTGTDFYLIGALARDLWYAGGKKTFRATKDVDFAVLVGSQQDYEAIREHLKQHNGFIETKMNSFVMISPAGVQVDILPFGEIEIDAGIKWTREGLTSIKVNGFSEVYHYGTAAVTLSTGHAFKVATLPAIVLLKLIAFDDRPDQRQKDARDIANIISHYFDLHADHIYDHHVDLFTDELADLLLIDISAIVIGREMKLIAKDNAELIKRLQRILSDHIAKTEGSSFVRNMVAETNSDVEQCVRWLKLMYASI